MSVIIEDVDKLVEALRLACGRLQGDLGNAGACRIERDFREVILVHAACEMERINLKCE